MKQEEKKKEKKYVKENRNKKEVAEKTEFTQWHPAFCSATKLELVKNKKDLQYHSEYGINTKPIQIDLLVIQKSKDVVIENQIGKIFKGHNIFEYKSGDDGLNVDTYFKTLAYACLYKAKAPKVDGIDAEDITITMARERKPVKLLYWFQEHEYEIAEQYKGIYYIKKDGFFDVQILVLKDLDPTLHVWLRSLTRKMKQDVAEKLILEMSDISEKDDYENADSVLQVAMKENKKMFTGLKEEYTMCEELRKLMEPEFSEAKRIAEEEGRRAGMEAGRKLGMEAGMEAGRKVGMKSGMELSLVVIGKLQEGKMVEEIAEETGVEIEMIELIKKTLGD